MDVERFNNVMGPVSDSAFEVRKAALFQEYSEVPVERRETLFTIALAMALPRLGLSMYAEMAEKLFGENK